MKEECEEQAELAVWVDKEKQIVTFRDTEEFEKLSYVYHLCEYGYSFL